MAKTLKFPVRAEVWMRAKEDGQVIKRRRLRKQLTQRELAFLARPCSQTTIYLLETGRMRTLSVALAMRIAKRLDVDVEDLFEERAAVAMPALSGVRPVSAEQGDAA